MIGGIWITGEDGQPQFLYYSEIDEEVLPAIFKPVGGFCYEADAFLHLPLTKAPFVLAGWLPKQGKMEIYGAPKSGKSFLAVQMARCLGIGEPFLGIPTVVSRVLYLQFELGEQVLQGRLKSTGHTYSGVYVGTDFALKLDTKGGQEQFQRALEAIKPQVLITDPLYKILTGDENESCDVRVVLDLLDRAIEAYGCSVVIIHHAGKDLERGGRGSSILEDWVDSCIEMKRTSKQGEPLQSRLTPKLLRHAETPPEPINLKLGDDFEFQLTNAPLTVKDKVGAFLKEHKGKEVSAQEIIDAGVGSRRSVYDALHLLENQKIVVKGEDGFKWVK